MSAAAPREQGVQLGLITRLRRLLQAELIAALGIIAGLLFGEIAGIVFAGRARGHQDIKVKGVAEGKTGRPKLAAVAGRQEGPQTLQQGGVGRRPLEDKPAAVQKGLHTAQEGGTLRLFQNLLHILHRARRHHGLGGQSGKVPSIIPGRRKSLRQCEWIAGQERIIPAAKHQLTKSQARAVGGIHVLIGNLDDSNMSPAERLGKDARRTIHPGETIPKAGTQLFGIGQPLVGKAARAALQPKSPTSADPDGLLNLDFRHD